MLSLSVGLFFHIGGNNFEQAEQAELSSVRGPSPGVEKALEGTCTCVH